MSLLRRKITPLEDNNTLLCCLGTYWQNHIFRTKAIRLRRSGDNAEEDFGFLNTNKFDKETAEAWIAAGGGTREGFCKTWYDQSDSGDINNLTMTTAGIQPLLVFDQYGQDSDLPYLDMNGKYLQCASLSQTLSGEFTLFFVCTTVSSGNLLDGINVNNFIRLQFLSGTTIRVYDDNGHQMNGSTATDVGTSHIIAITIRTPGNSYVHLDGSQEATSTSMDGTLPGLTLGAVFSGSTDYIGKLIAFAAFTEALSDADRQIVENELNKFYKIY